MPGNSGGEQLSAKRYVIVLLRLMVDEGGQLVHGEIMDVQGRSLGYFAGWHRLRRTLQKALASWVQKCTSEGD